MMNEDMVLVRDYASCRSETAFETLVTRHIGLVYSTAVRRVGDPHLAEEITQAVFILLARKAGSFGPRTILPTWLHRTACFAASDALKAKRRRERREQEAHRHSQPNETESGDSVWQQIAPLLDEAIAKLGEQDRHAIVLRFFQQRTFGEVGAVLRTSESAAKMRVNRAVEKLRRLFKKRGVTLTSAAIASALMAKATQASPPELAASIAGMVAKDATAGGSVSAIVNGTAKALAWAKYKVVTILALGGLLAGGAIMLAVFLSSPQSGRPVAPSRQTAIATPVSHAVREPLSHTTHMTLLSPPGALTLLPDGKLVIGATLFGWFVDTNSGALGYWSRGALRLNPDGSLDRTFLCDVGRHDSAAEMAHLSPAADGRLLVSGCFDAVDAEPRPGYAMLKADGSLDWGFQSWRGSNSIPGRTYLPGGTFPAVLLADGSVAVMCASVEGRRTSHAITAYRLDATGTWRPPASLTVGGTFSRPSGLIATLSGNGFSTRRAIAWTNNAPATPRPPVRYGSEIVELADSPAVQDIPFEQWTMSPSAAEAAVVLKALFEEVPLEMCRYALRLPDGGVLLAVRDGPPLGPSRLMRFDRDWRPGFSFANEFRAHPASRLTLRRQPDGKILVAGIVGQMNGEDFPGVVRLETDGRIDRSFRCDIANRLEGRVMDMALQEDGHILICGLFERVNGVEVPHLARLNPNGSLDQSFRTPFASWESLQQWRRVPVKRLAKTKAATEAPSTTKPDRLEADTPAQTAWISSLQSQGGTAVIRFTGIPRQAYVLQAAASLDSGDWTALSTSHTDAAGNGLFRDTETSSRPMRYYRIAIP